MLKILNFLYILTDLKHAKTKRGKSLRDCEINNPDGIDMLAWKRKYKIEKIYFKKNHYYIQKHILNM